MKNIVIALCLFAFGSSFAQSSDNRILNQYLVLLKKEVQPEALLHDFPQLQIKRQVGHHLNIWLFENTNAYCDAEKLLRDVQKHATVSLAQFNHHFQPRTGSWIPNDPFFVNQWNMLNDGNNGGTVDADIDADEAWAVDTSNLSKDGDSIVVAIIDGRTQLDHEDINYFINHWEVPENDIDEDGNGYIDDYYGWNSSTDSNNVNGSSNHAVHCGGIAAAKGNNGDGVIGVCPGAKVMFCAYGQATDDNVAEAYDYVLTMRALYDATAGAKGAFVVSTNSSFGVDFGDPADYPLWCAMYDSMGVYGILSAGAGPNLGIDIDVQGDIPTTCPSDYLIAVTNTNRNDNRNGGAGFGAIHMDIGAPGTSIYSCYTGNNYGSMSGTSMATPHIAGTVAAMIAHLCPDLIGNYKSFPDSIARFMKTVLLESAEYNPSLANQTVSEGRLNLLRVVTMLDDYNCNNCLHSLGVSTTGIMCPEDANGTATLNIVGGTAPFSILWSTGDTTSAISQLPHGYYWVTVTDSNGCERVKHFAIDKPGTVVFSNISFTPVVGANPGSIDVNAAAGAEQLTYSLDGVNFQSSDVFSIDSNGLYTVFAMNESGCIWSQTVNVIIGIHESSLFETVKAYPTLSTDEVNWEVSINKACTMNVTLMDATGRTVQQQQHDLAGGFHKRSIDVSALVHGFYLLKMEAGNSQHSFAVIR